MSLPWHVDPTPQTRRKYVCRRAPERPGVLDGRLDKPFWSGAAWTAEFVDILGLPPGHAAPTWATRACLLWDDENLYVGARMAEPHVWATLTEHDSIVYHDNDFEVFLSPTGDSHDYYEIEVNALGTVFDLHLARPYRDGGPADHDWNCEGLGVGVHIDGTLNDARDVDRGWSVELAIPWRALNRHTRMDRPVPLVAGAPPRAGDAWRLNFSRVEWDVEIAAGVGRAPEYRKVAGRPEHNWVWSPQGIVDMHRPEMWGEVVFEAGGPAGPPEARDWRAYEWLHAVYYAQRRHHLKHGRYARSLAELVHDQAGLAGAPEGWVGEIQPAGDAWRAWVRGPRGEMGIGADSRVWQGAALRPAGRG